ncbi:MAG: tRNA pseudouridine(55) synthase TruB [Actinobacteria bacterium]|nr:tRNA pseudouridine(55) synthase TruB [Actinomycetota bacterium]
MANSTTDGLLVVDKPAGCTSHDVVDRCRRAFGQRKVGHAGTLDPDATGVLLIGLGKVTRLLRWLSGLNKRYKGQVVLGVATTTLDAGGEVTGTWDMRGVTLEEACSAAARLTGEISQLPPMVSAVKVGGRRLHELARQGVEVERPSRVVTIKRFDVALAGGTENGPVLSVDVECSSGTYVRSLAAELGGLLGGGAHLRNLRRLDVGPFSVDAAVDLGTLEASPPEARLQYVLAPAEALPGMARAVVGSELAVEVAHGKVLPVEVLRSKAGPGGGAGPWAVLDEGGALLGVYEAQWPGAPGGEWAKPAVVLGPLGPGGPR